MFISKMRYIRVVDQPWFSLLSQELQVSAGIIQALINSSCLLILAHRLIEYHLLWTTLFIRMVWRKKNSSQTSQLCLYFCLEMIDPKKYCYMIMFKINMASNNGTSMKRTNNKQIIFTIKILGKKAKRMRWLDSITRWIWILADSGR